MAALVAGILVAIEVWYRPDTSPPTSYFDPWGRTRPSDRGGQVPFAPNRGTAEWVAEDPGCDVGQPCLVIPDPGTFTFTTISLPRSSQYPDRLVPLTRVTLTDGYCSSPSVATEQYLTPSYLSVSSFAMTYHSGTRSDSRCAL